MGYKSLYGVAGRSSPVGLDALEVWQASHWSISCLISLDIPCQ